MVRPLTSCSPAELLARAHDAIARAIAGRDDAADARPLGDVHLRAAQREAVRRVRRLLDRHGGAILADPVGVGKTFVALAVARHYADVVVVAPAALRAMWNHALRRTALAARFISYEQLSRGHPADAGPDFVIFDEAHHLRNPATRRHSAATTLCRRAPALLLSATPLQNSVGELVAQLSLFLGTRAEALAPHEMAAFIVRTVAAESAAGLPRLDGPHAVALGVDDDCLDLLLALPPPLPASDEGDGGVLLVYSLVRQWASSRAALSGALRRRLARAVAFGSALESGHRPSRNELAAWSFGGDAIQLALSELIVQPKSAPAELLASVRAHEAALRDVLAQLGSGACVDAARADALRRIRARHAGERIVAFSQFAETVRALGCALAPDGRVAWLTARGGHVASGLMSRRDLLAQLAPDGRPPPAAERVELLVSTDVLSEGLNLQAASVVVHIDLPWNPARLEQRVGRVRRLGSRHDVVTVYALAPPADAERLLHLRARLAEKLRLARRTVGASDALLPVDLFTPDDSDAGEAEALGRIHAVVATWQIGAPPVDAGGGADIRPSPDRSSAHTTPLIAAVAADRPGFIALVAASDDSGEPRLLACVDDVVSDRAGTVRRAFEAARCGAAVPLDAAALARATAILGEWWTGRRAADAVDLGAATSARARRIALTRLQRICARAPRHRRSLLSELAATARAALVAPLSRGDERELAALATAPTDDEEWLRTIVDFGTRAARGPGPGHPLADAPPLLVLILLQP